MEKAYRILKYLILVLAIAVVIAAASVLSNRFWGSETRADIAAAAQQTEVPETLPAETEAKGIEAPDFTVYDLEGNAHKLSDFRGKPVLLNFWASWCGPCQAEMPDFQKFYESHGDKVHFVIVNLTDGRKETVESASAFIAEKGYTFPVYYDTDIDAAMKYGVRSVPVSYFIDGSGYFVTGVQGALSADMLQQGMDMVLG